MSAASRPRSAFRTAPDRLLPRLRSRPAAILIDCDGVLVDSEPVLGTTLCEELAAHGVNASVDELHALFRGRAYSEICPAISRRYDVVLPSDFPERVTRRTLDVLAWRMTATPGAFAFLRSLSVPFCVVSNAPARRVSATLDSVGLSGFFPPNSVFGREHAARAKPAPDLFLAAAAAVEAAPPSCLAIEDSPTGAASARAAGMPVVGFTGCARNRREASEELLDAGCETVAGDMAELAQLIAEAMRNA